MVLVISVRIPRAPTYSGPVSPPFHVFEYGSLTLFASPSHALLLTCPLGSSTVLLPRLLVGLGSSAFARHYLRNRFYFLLLQVLRCFSSLRLACYDYLFITTCHPSSDGGFPHSDISGSLLAYCSPLRFAVCCVLLRLSVPRHSPYALSRLT